MIHKYASLKSEGSINKIPAFHLGAGFYLYARNDKVDHSFEGLPYYLKYIPQENKDVFVYKLPGLMSELYFREVRHILVEPKYLQHGDFKYLTFVLHPECPWTPGFQSCGENLFFIDQSRTAFPITFEMIMLLIAISKLVPFKSRLAAYSLCTNQPTAIPIKGSGELICAQSFATKFSNRDLIQPFARDSMPARKEKGPPEWIVADEPDYGPQSGFLSMTEGLFDPSKRICFSSL